MGSEHTPFNLNPFGYKSGDKINLDLQPKTLEVVKTHEIMPVVERMSQEVNKQVAEKYNLQNLLLSDGTVNTKEYSKENGGPYLEVEIEMDINNAQRKEQMFADNEKISLDAWRKNKYNSKSNRVELLTTILLYRVLKDKFIVMRNAPIDDYSFGGDYTLINPETGEAVCAFDGVAENDSGKSEAYKKENSMSKSVKTLNRLNTEKKDVRYGLVVENGKVKRGAIKNPPLFYLSLNDADYKYLGSMIMNLTGDINSPVSPKELEIFKGFVNSLEKQYEEQVENSRKYDFDMTKLNKFKNTLTLLQSLI